MHVLIPSAKRLGPDMIAETGCTLHAFIPIGGRPLYDHIAKAYAASIAAVRVSVVIPDDMLFEETESAQVEFIGIRPSKSIGETIAFALERLGDVFSNESPLVVHMGDTLIAIPEHLPLDVAFIEYREDIYRWTSLVESNGVLQVRNDRDANQINFTAKIVAVGVFTFSDAKLFGDILAEEIAEEETDVDHFFRALERYSSQKPMCLKRPDFWYDFGHVDSYYQSRLVYNNLRHFNHLEYDSETSIVTKTSQDVHQFRHQVRWYNQVPDDLRYFCPRIYASSDGEAPYITMELLPFPSLSDLFVYRRLELGAWNNVAKVLSRIHARFVRNAISSSTASALAKAMYRDKTIRRIELFLAQSPEAANYFIVHNGMRVSLSFVHDSLDEFLTRFGILDIKTLCPIHGDFCFSNLLYDHRSQMIKMIDPRGEFGVPGIYGDPRYDLAKLFHSVNNGYDFLVTNRFQAEVTDQGQLNLHMARDHYHDCVDEVLQTQLLRDNVLRIQVKAIQALLFLSMLPLHADRSDRQLAMLTIGLNQYASLALTNQEMER